MGSLLPDFAFVQNNDAIAILDRGEPVGDDQTGSVLHELIQSILDEEFGFGVDRRSGFI